MYCFSRKYYIRLKYTLIKPTKDSGLFLTIEESLPIIFNKNIGLIILLIYDKGYLGFKGKYYML